MDTTVIHESASEVQPIYIDAPVVEVVVDGPTGGVYASVREKSPTPVESTSSVEVRTSVEVKSPVMVGVEVVEGVETELQSLTGETVVDIPTRRMSVDSEMHSCVSVGVQSPRSANLREVHFSHADIPSPLPTARAAGEVQSTHIDACTPGQVQSTHVDAQTPGQVQSTRIDELESPMPAHSPDELVTPSPARPTPRLSASGKSSAPPPVPRGSLGKASPPSLPPPPPVRSPATQAPPPPPVFKSSAMGKASPPAMPGLVGSSPPVPSPAKASPPIPLRKAPPVPGGVPKAPPIPMMDAHEPDGHGELPLGRRLHWKPLRNVDHTIWATMEPDEEGLETDFTALKTVFDDDDGDKKKLLERSPKSKATDLLKGSGVAGNAHGQVVTLLEAKRAQNIGVVVARVPIEMVTERLRSLEIESLSVEVLERLKTVLPTEEEVACFNQYKGDPTALRDIEQKILSLFRMPRLTQRIRFCLVSIQLPQLVTEIRAEIHTFRRCVDEIRYSGKLKKLLHYVLLMGNYVNGAGGKKTRGFSIESLSKLMEFKSSADPSITTLHFLAVRLISTEPSLVDIYSSELPSLRSASKISSESVSQAVIAAKSDPDSIKNELANHPEHYTEESIGRMAKFVAQMGPKVHALTNEWATCEKELIEIRKFFGEDPRKISIDEFFTHLRLFLDSLNSTCADLKKRPKKFEKILRAEKAQQESRALA